MDKATLVHVYGKKVWIESDFLGDRHVMVQHDAPGEEPFCYASFHYDYRHTCNSGTMGDATRMALSLGATEPVEQRHRANPSFAAPVAAKVEWMPIESAPHHEEVLVYGKGWGVAVATHNGEEWIEEGLRPGPYITHWMPLPAAPATGQEGK